MFLETIVKHAVNLLASLRSALMDGLPPYLYVEGLLEGKEVLDDCMTRVLYISSQKV